MAEPAAKKAKLGKDGHFHEHFTDPAIDNIRIDTIQAMIYPQLLLEEYPLSEQAKRTVSYGREASTNIVMGTDDRLIVIIGPCSIHDPKSALEYAVRLKSEADRSKRQSFHHHAVCAYA